MRHITPEGLELIRRWESLQLLVYLCPGNYWTIGYGHYLRAFDKERDTRTHMANNPYPNGISKAYAERLLALDVADAEAAVLRLIRVPLTDGQFAALVSFTFNLGAGRLQASTLRRRVNAGLHEEAATEFGKWVFSGGKKLRGLVLRRQEEAMLYATVEALVPAKRAAVPADESFLVVFKSLFGGRVLSAA